MFLSELNLHECGWSISINQFLRIMKKKIILVGLIIVMSSMTAESQNTRRGYGYHDDEEYYENDYDPHDDYVLNGVEVYYSTEGYYHWEIVEKRVWIPGYVRFTRFGIEAVPGHWEIITERMRCYDVSHFPPPPVYYHKHKHHKHKRCHSH